MRAVFQQQERYVVVAVPAGVPVHGCHQRIQRLVTVGRSKRRDDLVLGEEVPVLVPAFDQPVGVEQEPVTGPPARGERGQRGEVSVQAQRRVGRLAGERPQAAAVVQQRRVVAAVDDGEFAAGRDLGQRRGDEVLLAQVRPDGLADVAGHLV
jgi:hypothetical protein